MDDVVEKEEAPITFCNSGMKASSVTFLLHYLDYKPRLFNVCLSFILTSHY